MDQRENARDRLQAMSFVNPKERTRGFGVFLSPAVGQTGGWGGGWHVTSRDTDSQGKVAKSLRCFGEFKASWWGGGDKESLSRWAGRPLLPPRGSK